MVKKVKNKTKWFLVVYFLPKHKPPFLIGLLTLCFIPYRVSFRSCGNYVLNLWPFLCASLLVLAVLLVCTGKSEKDRKILVYVVINKPNAWRLFVYVIITPLKAFFIGLKKVWNYSESASERYHKVILMHLMDSFGILLTDLKPVLSIIRNLKNGERPEELQGGFF